MSAKDAYQITGLQGRGRFGVVYRATGPTGEVALKRASLGWDDAEVDRKAAEAVAGLAHPGLVTPTRWLFHGDSAWAVLPLIPGIDLSELGAPLPTRVALSVALGAASALAALRECSTKAPNPPDLRPSHVRLTPAGEVLLVDLWQGKVDPSLEERRRWLAPELLKKRASNTSDVYALGVIVNQLLGGDPIGAPGTNAGRHGVQVSLALDSLSERKVSEPLVGLLSHMLAYQQRTRPSMGELVMETAELIEDLAGQTLQEWAPKGAVRPALDPTLERDSRIGAHVRDEGWPSDRPKPAMSVVPSASRARASVNPAASRPPRGETPVHRIPLTPRAPAVERLDAVRPISVAPASEDDIPTYAPPSDRQSAPADTEEEPPTDATEMYVPEETGPAVEAVVLSRLSSIPPEEAQLGVAEPSPFHTALDESMQVPSLTTTLPPTPFPDEEPVEVPRQLSNAMLIVGGLGLALVVALLGYVLGGGVYADEIPKPKKATAAAPAPAPERPAPAAGDPAVDPEPEAPEPRPEPASIAVPAPAQPVQPAPRPAPDAPPPPPPPPQTNVKVSGDQAQVWLVAHDGKRFALPGPIAPGNYEIDAQFPGSKAAPAGSVTVPPSGNVELHCDVLTAQCTPRSGR